MKKSLFILIASGLIFSASCNEHNNNNEKEVSHNSHSHWGYAGESGPKFWGELKNSYIDCKVGKRQSPIDINKEMIKNSDSLKSLYFDYKDASINIINNGHTIQVNSDNNSFALFQGKEFKLLQFHFHALSEHTVNGEHYAMEMHLVHQAEDGELGVVGVFFKVGEYNRTMQKVLKFMPKDSDSKNEITNFTINPTEFLPINRDYYHYLGSLTTPPCTQLVEWYVMKEPIEISQKQLEQFQRLYSKNYRPVTPLNGRVILEK